MSGQSIPESSLDLDDEVGSVGNGKVPSVSQPVLTAQVTITTNDENRLMGAS
jgi:hypothetical protein